MKIAADSSPFPTETADRSPPAKPASASCCHALAVLAVVVGCVMLAVAIFSESPDIALAAVGGATVASAVFWWVLGDIVVSVARIARR